LSLVALPHFFDLLQLDVLAEEELVPPHHRLVAEFRVFPTLLWQDVLVVCVVVVVVVVVVVHPVEQVLLSE
jgi:hypothetical protein